MNYPQQRPRQWRRSNDRWLGGVCGGLAEYLNMDPTLIRVLVIVLAVVTSVVPVAIAYLVLMLMLPEAGSDQRGSIGPAQRFGWQQPGSDSVWGAAGPPWRPRRDPNIDTSAPQPPRQSPEDLFSRAKHPTKPTGSSPTGSPESQEKPADDKPES